MTAQPQNDIPAPENEPAAQPSADAQAVSADHLAAALALADAREKQAAEANDKMLRALAEAENIRRRAEKEKQDTAKFAVSSFARDLLTVADNLRRALSAFPEDQKNANPQVKNLFIGIEATEREMLRALENAGIKKVDPAGSAFDPNFHEVMFEVEAPDQIPGTVVQVIEPGYVIHERLLRPARVGVAKGGKTPDASRIDQNV